MDPRVPRTRDAHRNAFLDSGFAPAGAPRKDGLGIFNARWTRVGEGGSGHFFATDNDHPPITGRRAFGVPSWSRRHKGNRPAPGKQPAL
jgi:hypothetical protein